MQISLDMMGKGLINPAAMVTHVGGLNSVADTVLNLPNIPGGKKLIYTNIDMELTAIDDFREKGKTDPFFAELADIVEKEQRLVVSRSRTVSAEKCKTHLTLKKPGYGWQLSGNGSLPSFSPYRTGF